jgi:hypothetical protein
MATNPIPALPNEIFVRLARVMIRCNVVVMRLIITLGNNGSGRKEGKDAEENTESNSPN